MRPHLGYNEADPLAVEVSRSGGQDHNQMKTPNRGRAMLVAVDLLADSHAG